MATTATAATISSSIYKNTLTIKHPSDPFLANLHFTKTFSHKQSALVSYQCHGLTDPTHIGHVAYKWRALRVYTMVAEEETAETGSEEVVDEVEVGKTGEGERASESEGDQVNTKLYFGNLPYHCDSAQLAGFVQQYGTPELIEVLYDRDSGKSRGFAFVTMSSVEDCNAVVENLDGCEYGGRYLRVNFADKPRRKEPLFPETEHKLFVGNLSWSVTSESLFQAFQAYGNVVGARVLHDGETGKSKGYGFVCYATRSEMENALVSLNGMELEGRAMRVSLAEGKKL